uniref:KIB1-4 beta-propeller domain-containing protein n=1 Tax=Oryza glumipatula TaxID=40148 RepID=A0A0E0A4N0_9ORYZ
MSPSTSRRLAAPSLFLVLYDDADGGRPTTTLYDVANGVHRPCDVDDELLRTKRSWATSHGSWVLTWDPATLATFLWNPQAAAAAGEVTSVALPSFGQAPPAIKACCAISTGEPTGAGGGFTVVMIERGSNVLWYCHAGGGAASGVGVVGEARRTICSFTPCGGKLYYLIKPGGSSYSVLEFSPEHHRPVFTAVRVRPTHLLATADLLVYSVFPVDVNGELHLVFIFRGENCNTVADVAVYRVDMERRKHVRIGSIGDRAILVGGRRNDMGAAGWCRARRHGLLPNSIYWMDWDGRLRL